MVGCLSTKFFSEKGWCWRLCALVAWVQWNFCFMCSSTDRWHLRFGPSSPGNLVYWATVVLVFLRYCFRGSVPMEMLVVVIYGCSSPCWCFGFYGRAEMQRFLGVKRSLHGTLFSKWNSLLSL